MNNEIIVNGKKYHLSEYNIYSYAPDKNFIRCVNLLKGSYSEIKVENIVKLYRLQNSSLEEKYIQQYINQGILVNFNEKEFIKSNLLLKNKNDFLKILITPTLNCNFNCSYCFEKHDDKSKMSLETQNNVINFIKDILNKSNKKGLKITWYGGEPLLCPEIIENISKSLISFCEEKGIYYKGGMLSNGFLFNEKNVKLLNECKVTQIQITLDGLQKTHDLTRHLINGEGSFNKILENLKKNKFNGVINIRHNIYEDNKQEIEELKNTLKEIENESGNIINYYSAPIIDVSANKDDKQVKFLNIKDTILFEFKRRKNKIPSLRTNYCSAHSLYFLGIDHKGKLYKCYEDFGFEERSFGDITKWNINNPIDTADNPDILMKYINSAGILDEECCKCIWLPICGGGCPSKLFFHNMKCLPYVPYKYDVDYYIDKIYDSYIKNE